VIDASPIGADLARVLTQTGKRHDQLDTEDLDEFAAACRARQHRTGWLFRSS
jgi:hypothetical protein